MPQERPIDISAPIASDPYLVPFGGRMVPVSELPEGAVIEFEVPEGVKLSKQKAQALIQKWGPEWQNKLITQWWEIGEASEAERRAGGALGQTTELATTLGMAGTGLGRLGELAQAARGGRLGSAAAHAAGGAANVAGAALDPIPSVTGTAVDSLVRLAGRSGLNEAAPITMSFARPVSQAVGQVGGEELKLRAEGRGGIANQPPGDIAAILGLGTLTGGLGSIGEAASRVAAGSRTAREMTFIDDLKARAGIQQPLGDFAFEPQSSFTRESHERIAQLVDAPKQLAAASRAQAAAMADQLSDARVTRATLQNELRRAKDELKTAQRMYDSDGITKWQARVDQIEGGLSGQNTNLAEMRAQWASDRNELVKRQVQLETDLRTYDLEPSGPISRDEMRAELAEIKSTVKLLDAQFKADAAAAGAKLTETRGTAAATKRTKPINLAKSVAGVQGLPEGLAVTGLQESLDALKIQEQNWRALSDMFKARAASELATVPARLPPDIPNANAIFRQLGTAKSADQFNKLIVDPDYLKVALAVAPQQANLLRQGVLSGIVAQTVDPNGRLNLKSVAAAWNDDRTLQALRLVLGQQAGDPLVKKARETAAFFAAADKNKRLIGRLLEHGTSKLAFILTMGAGGAAFPLSDHSSFGRAFSAAAGVGIGTGIIAAVNAAETITEKLLVDDRFRKAALSWALTGDAGRLGGDAGRYFNAWVNRDKPAVQ